MTNKYIHAIMEQKDSVGAVMGIPTSPNDVLKSLGLDRHIYQIKRTTKKVALPIGVLIASGLIYNIYKSTKG
jgi:invasion protein IalB